MSKGSLAILSVAVLFGCVLGGKEQVKRGVGVAYAQPTYAAVPLQAQALYAQQPYGGKLGYAQPAGGVLIAGGGYGGYAGNVGLLNAGGALGLANAGGFVLAAPKNYRQSIPAAAIRNVEIVGITKTITPVVTKTITRKTHSEPAVSIGHVQGYSNSAIGHAKVAPVQYITAYTAYANPTVGVNGPVTYTGAAVGGAGLVAAAPVAVNGGGGGGVIGVGGGAIAPVAVGRAAVPLSVGHGSIGGLNLGYGGLEFLGGAPLTFDSYGADLYSSPVAPAVNFIDVKAGHPTYAKGHSGGYGH